MASGPGSLAATINSKMDENNPGSGTQLQVSVPMLMRVPSCQKAYGELELRNTHPSETIFIHNIQKSMEQTTVIRKTWSENPGRIWDDESIPQQLHLSRLPSGSLALEPGQKANVPFTFFPQYPQADDIGGDKGTDTGAHEESDETRSTAQKFPSASSSIFELDWKDVVGHDLLNQIKGKAYDNLLGSSSFKKDTFQPRSNLDWNGSPVGDEYQLRTTLVLKTSRGVQKVPLTASSVRTNPQGIPDTIYFRHDTAAATAAKTRQSDSAMPTSATPAAYLLHAINFGWTQGNMGDSNDDTSPPPSRDCFDLYLSNPDPLKPRRIREIMVSRPDLMSVEFDPSKSFLELLDASGRGTPHTIPPSPMIRHWRNSNHSGNSVFSTNGPMILPADSVDNYVATICTVVDGLGNTFANGPFASLRTPQGQHDYLSEAPNFGSSEDHRSLGYVKLQTDETTLFIALKEMKDDVSLLSLSTAAGNPIQGPAPVSEESSLLKVEPEKLDFHLSTTNNVATTYLSVKNKAPFNMKIVRIATGIRLDRKWRDLLGNNVTETMGLNITTRMKLFDEWEVDVAEKIYWDNIAEVRKGDYRENMIVVECNLTSGTVGMPMETLHTTGSIVIRGTTETEIINGYDLPYKVYREFLEKDMFADEHFILEIPFTVTVENGRVHAMIEKSTHPYPQIFSLQPWDKSGKMISSLFFPATRLQAIGDSEKPLPPQNYKGAKEISHDLLLVSSKAMPLGITSVEVVEADNSPISSKASLCNRFNVSMTDPFEMVADQAGQLEHAGYLSLQYKFGKQKGGGKERSRGADDEQDENQSTTCYLNIVTTPENAVNHQIPLVIFPGQLAVSTQNKKPTASESTVLSSDSQEAASMSIQQLVTRLRNSVVGKAYLEVIEAKGFEKGARGLRKFLSQAYRKSSKLEDLILNPVLMKIGALERDGVYKTPLVLTNHNPVPISVSIDSGDLQGMRSVLNKESSSESQGPIDRNNMMNNILLSESQEGTARDGKYEGHPVEGLRQFILSNEKAKSFATRFASHGAVEAAGENEALLRSLYHRHSSMELFNGDGYGKRNCTSLDSSPWDGPSMIVSADKTLVKHLPSCSESGTDSGTLENEIVSIPPGGTARFDVIVTAPSSEVLNTDITRIVASGLSLSTSLGQVIPILITFEALQGQLHVSEEGRAEDHAGNALVSSDNAEEKLTVIEVPLGLYWASHIEQVGKQPIVQIPTAYIESFLQARSKGNTSIDYMGTSLLLKSTFSRDVRLLEVESCNPLFHFVQSGENMTHSEGGIRIGHLFSAVSCSSADDRDSMFPSYFQCALNWLGSRESLQPSGCGRLRTLPKSTAEVLFDSGDGGAGRVSQAFERVVSLLKEMYAEKQTGSKRRNATSKEEEMQSLSGSMGVKSGRTRSDGIVAPFLVSTFAEAWDAWRVAASSGLGVLSSNLRATIEYETTSRGTGARKTTTEKQSLSLSMHNLAVQSVLNAPMLFRGSESGNRGEHKPSVIKLPPVLVGETVAAMIPLENPTAVPVKVRLAAPSRLNYALREHDQAGGVNLRTRLFLQSLVPPYVQNGRLDSTDNTSPHHLWWEGGGAFFMSDGRGNLIRSNHNITLKAGKGAFVNLVNPSLHTNSAFVVGCGVRCGIREHNSKMRREMSGPHVSSPIGAAAAAGISLLGKQHLPHSQVITTEEPYVQSGGVPGNGGPTAFAIPYPALDEIVIPPFGKAEVGPILFRPPGKFGVLGCELVEESDSPHWGGKAEEYCNKKTFETIVLLENSLTGLERVVVEGRSFQDRLNFLDPLPRFGEDAFGSIENRNGRSTLVFSGTSSLGGDDASDNPIASTSIVEEVVLQNTGDLEQSIRQIYLRGTDDVQVSDPCTFGSFRLLNCWDSPQHNFVVNELEIENVHAGFKLSPGESKTLFIEHIADCKRQEEAISLHVDYTHARATTGSKQENYGGNRRTRKRQLETHKSISLGVGYFMTEYEATGCVPAKVNGIRVVHREKEKTEFHLRTEGSRERKKDKNYTARIYDCIVLLVAFALLAYSWTMMPYDLERILCAFLPSRMVKNGLTEKPQPLNQQWLSSYLLLSRTDPTPSDLVSFGHVQMSHGIIQHYKEYETDPPENMSFKRDRLARTESHMLSDTLFPKREIELTEPDAPLLPLGLRWNTALSRGIITNDSNGRPMTKTQELLLKRQNPTERCDAQLERNEKREIEVDDDYDSYDSYVSYNSVDGSDDELEGNNEDTPEESSEDTPEEYAPEEDTADEDELVELSAQEPVGWEEGKVEQKPEESVTAPDKGLVATEVVVDTLTDAFGDFQPVSKNGKSKERKHEITTPSTSQKKNKSKTSRKSEQPQAHPQQQEKQQPEGKQGKQGNKTSEQKASKATSKNKANDAKIKTEGKLESETKSKGKRTSQKGDSKESKKNAATTGKGKQDASARGKIDGTKQTKDSSQQTAKQGTKERGKSQSQSKKAARGSSEQGKDNQNAKKESQKDKTSKSERGRKEKPAESEPKAEKTSKRKKKKSKKERQEAAAAAASKAASPKWKDKKAQATAVVTEKTSKDQIPTVPVLRPPPGLAPPPGFQTDGGQDPSVLPSTLGPMLDSVLPAEGGGPPALAFLQGYSPRDSPSSSLPILTAEPTGNQPPLFGSTGNQQRRTSLETGFMPPAPIDTSRAAAGAQGDDGFDVMDFLGSILNESVPEQAPLEPSPFNQDPSLMLAGNSPILSNNPWASEGQSRASAYGIAFESDARESQHSSIIDAAVLASPGNQSLLTPDSLNMANRRSSSSSLLSPAEVALSNIGSDPGGRLSGSPSLIIPATSVFPAEHSHQRNNSQEEEELVESWLMTE